MPRYLRSGAVGCIAWLDLSAAGRERHIVGSDSLFHRRSSARNNTLQRAQGETQDAAKCEYALGSDVVPRF